MSEQLTIVAAAQKLEGSKKTEGELLEQHMADVVKLLKEVNGSDDEEPFVIETDEDFEFIGKLLKHTKKQKSDLEKRRKTVTLPMHQALEAFRAFYRPTLKKLEELERVLKKKVSDYHQLLREREEEKARLLAEASRENDFEKAMDVSSTMRAMPKVSGIVVTDKWDYEIEDEDKVPREYMVVSDEMMKAHIKKSGKAKPKEISGIRFFKVSGVSAGKK